MNAIWSARAAYSTYDGYSGVEEPKAESAAGISYRGSLLAVLANPPMTPGLRTMARVDLARDMLGYANVSVANIFAVPSMSTLEIAATGGLERGWMDARAFLESGLESADGVLLAYGVSAPSGPARFHFRNQIEWLYKRLDTHRLPTWTVGGRPRHPSRWQRWTSRNFPGLNFQEALKHSFRAI